MTVGNIELLKKSTEEINIWTCSVSHSFQEMGWLLGDNNIGGCFLVYVSGNSH